jgi:hypothetical protein
MGQGQGRSRQWLLDAESASLPPQRCSQFLEPFLLVHGGLAQQLGSPGGVASEELGLQVQASISEQQRAQPARQNREQSRHEFPSPVVVGLEKGEHERRAL